MVHLTSGIGQGLLSFTNKNPDENTHIKKLSVNILQEISFESHTPQEVGPDSHAPLQTQSREATRQPLQNIFTD